MRAYVDVRAEGERLLRESGIPATFVRPWYVLGPGSSLAVRDPAALLAGDARCRRARDTARRLYPVRWRKSCARCDAVERPRCGRARDRGAGDREGRGDRVERHQRDSETDCDSAPALRTMK